MRTVVIVQARTRSSRLPGKVLKPVLDRPVLAWMLERVRLAKTPFKLVLATTPAAADAPLVDLAKSLGVSHFCGDEEDCLDRHYQAAKIFAADVVVKIPSDCPLIDPRVIDQVLAAFFARDEDFTSNLHPPTHPDGNDVEVMRFSALERAWKEARAPHEREHTTPYIWDNPNLFRVGNVLWETGRDDSKRYRLTLDYAEDFELIKTVFERFYNQALRDQMTDHPASGDLVANRATPGWLNFSLADILALFAREPEIPALNARYNGVNWYRNHLADLKTVDARDTRRVES